MQDKLNDLDEIIKIQKQQTTPNNIYATGILNGLLSAKSIITGCEFHPFECDGIVHAPMFPVAKTTYEKEEKENAANQNS